jgi:hypothetical protein
MKTEIHSMAIERDWLDGLRAINELFEHAQGERLRWCRIGKGLLAGRLKCSANLDYHDWLDQTGYRAIARNERQDAMWLTVNAPIALPALEETRIGNPEWARRHIRENLPAIYAKCTDARAFTEASVNESHPASTSDQPQIAPQESEKIASTISQEGKSATELPRKEIRRRSALSGLPDADLVNAHLVDSHTKAAIAKIARTPKGRPAWALLIEAIETGLFRSPSTFYTANPTIRVLLPWLPPRAFDGFLLKDAYAQKMARDVLFPMLRERTDLHEMPHLVEREFQARRREIEEAARRRSKLDDHRAKIEAGGIAADEKPIIAFGEPLWPPQRPDLTSPYTYKELCHACWFVGYFLGIARPGWKPTETAMAARHLVKYIEPVQPGFVAAVRSIFNAYEDHPDGEKQFPPIPVNFGN